MKETRLNPYEFEYRLLSRLQQDCEYYLNHGGRHKGHLWAKDEKLQIAKMKSLYKKVKPKPKWLSWSDILKYEKLMVKTPKQIGEAEVMAISKLNPPALTQTEALKRIGAK